ncbi:ultraviolet-B receptor UVR8, partial [Acrasis kona]
MVVHVILACILSCIVFADDCNLYSKINLYAFGYNGNGQLGVPSIPNQLSQNYSTKPLPMSMKGVESRSFKQVSLGSSHTVALTINSEIYGWGANQHGQLASPDYRNFVDPVKVERTGVFSEEFIIDIKAGVNFTVALAASGALYTWGSNSEGQLGIGSSMNRSHIPTAIFNMTFKSVACGASHVVALSSNGLLYSWGSNSASQLGLSDEDDIMDAVFEPVQVSGDADFLNSTFVSVQANGRNSIALTINGVIYMWGDNQYAQLGLAGELNFDDYNKPLVMDITGLDGLNVLRDFSLGSAFCVLVSKNQRSNMVSWGYNKEGELGIGKVSISSRRPNLVDMSNIPFFVSNYSTIRNIVAGKSHALVITFEGEIYGWGSDLWGQLAGTEWERFSKLIPTRIDFSQFVEGQYVLDIPASCVNSDHTVLLTIDRSNLCCNNVSINNPEVCSGASQGKCINWNECECQTGYSGRRCELFTCYGKLSTDPSACNYGTCEKPDKCKCITGFSGDQCESASRESIILGIAL